MNKRLIKESAIIWLKAAMAGAEEFSTINIVGTYAKEIGLPLAICSVGNEKIVTNKENGLLSWNFVNDTMTYLYKSWYSLKINVYDIIDDEADRIAEIIVDRIREYEYPIIVADITVEKISDTISTGDAGPYDLSGTKSFTVPIVVQILCYEIKTIRSE